MNSNSVWLLSVIILANYVLWQTFAYLWLSTQSFKALSDSKLKTDYSEFPYQIMYHNLRSVRMIDRKWFCDSSSYHKCIASIFYALPLRKVKTQVTKWGVYVNWVRRFIFNPRQHKSLGRNSIWCPQKWNLTWALRWSVSAWRVCFSSDNR